jgi:hypothetical protein
MAALVCLGALGNVWLHQATDEREAGRRGPHDDRAGLVISRDQLMTVQVGSDPALRSRAGQRS